MILPGAERAISLPGGEPEFGSISGTPRKAKYGGVAAAPGWRQPILGAPWPARSSQSQGSTLQSTDLCILHYRQPGFKFFFTIWKANSLGNQFLNVKWFILLLNVFSVLTSPEPLGLFNAECHFWSPFSLQLFLKVTIVKVTAYTDCISRTRTLGVLNIYCSLWYGYIILCQGIHWLVIFDTNEDTVFPSH